MILKYQQLFLYLLSGIGMFSIISSVFILNYFHYFLFHLIASTIIFFCLLDMIKILHQKGLLIWKKLTLGFFICSFILGYCSHFLNFPLSCFLSIFLLLAYSYFFTILTLESIQKDSFHSTNILSNHLLIIFYLYIPYIAFITLLKENPFALFFIIILITIAYILSNLSIEKLVNFKISSIQVYIINFLITTFCSFFLIHIFSNFFTQIPNIIFYKWYLILLVNIIIFLSVSMSHQFELIFKNPMIIQNSDFFIHNQSKILFIFSPFLVSITNFFIMNNIIASLF